MKLLTISVAGYNVEKYISQVLDSLCCENINKIEVFIIDDGGNDRTLEIANEYSRRFPDCFFPIHKQNGGWGSTVNYSIQHATGKYFKLLDGDDFFNTVNLDKFIKHLENFEADIIYTPYLQFDHTTGKKVIDFDISSSYTLFKEYAIHKLAIRQGLDMHAIAFKTEVLKKHDIHITERAFYTDNEYRAKGIAFSKTIVFTNFQLYNYRVGLEGQSVNISGLQKHCNDTIRIAQVLIDFHRTASENYPPFVMVCVKNSIDFAYRTLLFLKLKKKLQEFDEYLKEQGQQYYKTNFTTIKLLRLFNMHGTTCLSFLLRTKYSYLPKIKRYFLKQLLLSH